MKFTFSWLRDHLDTSAPLEQITSTLTANGLEVEQVIDNSKVLEPFVVAEILHAEQHPNADKLRVCRVTDGSSERVVVCGAPNARTGIKVVLAREGVWIPADDFKIKKTTIRGVESNGMLCSERELALGNDSAGIIELPADATLGESIVKTLGLNDPVIEIAVTANRGDALSVRGIARDVAAAGLGTVKPLKHKTHGGSFTSPVAVTIADTKACPMFVGCYIKGAKNGESPAWLQQRLKAIGLRPISALVDITNYITYDLGRPLHVYDAAKLKGNITVRTARKGEKLTALNDREYMLDEGMLTITDDSGVIGLGGIIGGTSTGCTDTTTDVFLEAALFDPITIARIGRALQIDSDARYRFERGVDPAFVKTGAEIAVALIQQLCGGEASKLVVAGAEPAWQRSISFRPARIQSFGGIAIEEKKIFTILEALGFGIQKGRDTWEVSVPSWRPDVEGEADIIEEVLRIYGYDNIPTVSLPKPATIAKPVLTPAQRRTGLIRRALAANGLIETCSYPFIEEKHAALFGNTGIKLANPISAEHNTMRPSLLPGLLSAVAKNIARGFTNLALFELGTQFEGTAPDQQKPAAAMLRAGHNATKNLYKNSREVDVFDAKEDALVALAEAGINTSKLQVTATAPAWYHPGRSGVLMLGKTALAYFGELHPTILKAWDITSRAVAAEILLANLPEPRAKATKTKPALAVSDYQAVERDFAFVVDEKLSAAELLRAIESAEKQLITNVSLFDIYSGKGVEAGKKSIAVAVTLQAQNRTLTEEEINTVYAKIVAAAGTLGGILRT